MRRFAVVAGAALLVVVCLSCAQAQASVTLTFDPDALIQAYPTTAGTSDVAGQNKVTQTDARRLHQPWGTVYETFYNPASPQPQPNSYNTYMNWRDSFGVGEGIAVFNSWFMDNGAARSWGETVVVKPETPVTGTAADGWNVTIVDDPYGLGGASVQWWTTDLTKRINATSSIGDFSITADLYWDNNANGWDASDPAVVAGQEVRFWAGNLNGDDPGYYRTDTQALYFDDLGWGSASPANGGPFSALYSSGAGNQGSGFEAALSAIATVPEPSTLVIWSVLGTLGIALGWWRKRRVAA
ncbi:MAG: hypothetical protein ACYC35_25680 [Pirellulales bacterium]